MYLIIGKVSSNGEPEVFFGDMLTAEWKKDDVILALREPQDLLYGPEVN